MAWKSQVAITDDVLAMLLGIPDNVVLHGQWDDSRNCLILFMRSYDGPAFIDGQQLTMDTPEGAVAMNIDSSILRPWQLTVEAPGIPLTPSLESNPVLLESQPQEDDIRDGLED